ncbi:hypothetical protein FRAAL4984 [Frankia alni ACN14a]|uniref:Uncharacterized protein n=1 Tax=Frankia alni (strain DSM 45986 / CECT 9034 / ACN14a) TaxID=326424 RepID=Q0RFW5_FRAAA|nr:hypothetical protein FRAAL4984 [Frankia alni ACN14a]
MRAEEAGEHVHLVLGWAEANGVSGHNAPSSAIHTHAAPDAAVGRPYTATAREGARSRWYKVSPLASGSGIEVRRAHRERASVVGDITGCPSAGAQNIPVTAVSGRLRSSTGGSR